MVTFYQTCAAVLFFVFGTCIGSFSNVVIYRLPRGMSLASPPSHCPACDHPLAARDNIPLFSFLFLRGKCRYCGAPITPRYFFIELLSGLLWLGVFCVYGDDLLRAAVLCCAVSVLLCIALCDAENLWIPDPLQAALALCGLVLLLLSPSALAEKLLGAAVGGGVYLFFYLSAILVFGREGMGFGDIKLMTAMGLFLGWKKTLLTIFFGSLFALALLFSAGRKRELLGGKREYPLAPPLVAAGILALLLGDRLIGAYLALFV